MIWAYLAGLATVPTIVAVIAAAIWSFSKEVGYGPCDHCNHLGGKDGHDMGTRTNIAYWFDSTLHAKIWARTRRHRIARGNAWRDKDSSGFQNTRWYPKYMI